MREYGQIQSSYWTHPDIQALSVEAKVIGAYLLTCQHTNGIGCFRIPMGYVSIDLGLGIETVSIGFRELFEKGFLEHDSRSEYVLIPSFLRWNPISNPNSAKARIKEFELVPSSISIYGKLIKALQKHGKYWGEEFEDRLETLSEPYRNPINTVPADVPDNQTQPLPLPDPNTEDANASLSPDAGDDEPPGERPPDNPPSKPSAPIPICPANRIVEAYNRICTSMPRAKYDSWSEPNKRKLRARWKWLMSRPISDDENGRTYADDVDAAIAWWETFFRFAEEDCPHLAGENDRGWTADLLWLICPTNFDKVKLGRYRRTAARAAR